MMRRGERLLPAPEDCVSQGGPCRPLYGMASNATTAGILALGLAVMAGLGGCGNEPTGQSDQGGGGVIGELSVVSVLGSTNHSSLLYFLRPSDGSASVPLL